jgi:hypothetical protein
MAYANLINKSYSEFYLKAAIVALALIPVAVFSKRFFVRQGRFPTTSQ